MNREEQHFQPNMGDILVVVGVDPSAIACLENFLPCHL